MTKAWNTGFVLLLILLGINLSLPNNSFGQKDSSSIKEMLEQRDKEIKELVGPKGTEYTDQQRAKLKDIINGVVDYRTMAQFALQNTYDTLSVEQREEFVDLFSSIIRDQSLNRLDIYRADVKYENIEVEGDSAVVSTIAQLERVRTPVTYQMDYDNEENGWVVTDIIIDDVSTAGSYRRQFQNIINKKGYESLVETLRKRVS